VPRDRLDDVLPANQHIDIIKLDTQGAEPDILAGAAALIDRCHPILLLEWWPWGLRDRPDGAANFARQLEAFGYIAGIVSDTGFVEPCAWPGLVDRCAVDQHQGLTLICSTRPLEDLLPASIISVARESSAAVALRGLYGGGDADIVG
jgi:hypothetical protein